MKNTIELYHYTRANKQSIELNGLIIRTKESSRQIFIDEFKSKLPSNVLNYFTSAWSSECVGPKDYDPQAVYFVSERPKSNCPCIRPLLSMYGGEVISMVADGNDNAQAFLESIGVPLEVVCSIPIDDPNLVNLGSTELYLMRDVIPSEIKTIRKLFYDVNKNQWNYPD